MSPICSFDDVRPEVASFASYVPGLSIAETARRYGLSRIIKMASNENPLGVSPKVCQAIMDNASGVFRYPQSGAPRLVKALAQHYQVAADTLFVGNGSGEIIDLLFRVRAVPGVHNVVAFRPCFGLYPTQAQLAGVTLRQAPLNDDFSFNFDRLKALIDENTTLVFVTSPDNPSGRMAAQEDLKHLAESLPPSCLLVVDEAYVDFAGPDQSLVSQLKDFPHIAIVRTFSKLYGLAGLRIGYAFLPGALAGYLWRVRLPFSLNIMAEEAALAALEDTAFQQQTIDLISRSREEVSNGLAALGCHVLPSRANFIMFRPPEGISAHTIYTELLRLGIIIRALHSYNLPDWLRVSIGTQEENTFFLHCVQDILNR